MTGLDPFGDDDTHPINIVEALACTHAWEFDRITDDQIAMSIEGQWRTYAITLVWCETDQTLRLLCTFEMAPPAEALPKLYEGLNAVNDRSWCGSFTWWADHQVMIFRYGLMQAEDVLATPDQIDRMIMAAVTTCERYYPAFQLMIYDDQTPEQALQIAIADAYGRA
ncbi:MAG: YbjN domain-containing protein [Paracoccaceae bacterium]